MAKKQRTPSYLSPSALIAKGHYSNSEYNEYKENRQKIQAMNLKERGRELTSEEKYRADKERYEKRTMGGKIGTQIAGAYRTATTRHGITQALFRRQGQLPPQNVENRFKTVQGMKSGRRGRPAGTLDKRYAAYGGVYGYRKAVALERFKQRQQILQARAVSPQQQMALNQIRARQQYDQSNPEGKIIPDTRGQVDMAHLMQEIMDAANAVG